MIFQNKIKKTILACVVLLCAVLEIKPGENLGKELTLSLMHNDIGGVKKYLKVNTPFFMLCIRRCI